MSKTASSVSSRGVQHLSVNDLLARLIGATSRLQRIRILLSLVQESSGANRTGLVVAQAPETVFWEDRTEHPTPFKVDVHETHQFAGLLDWAEDQPTGYVAAKNIESLPTSYDITGVIVLCDGQELTGTILLTGDIAPIDETESFKTLLNLLTMTAIEQRTTHNLNKFLDDFAHDQRNILGVVSLSADALDEVADLSPKSKVHLNRIFDNSLQLGNQIENALSVERYNPETDEYHMVLEQVDLVDLRREICQRYFHVAQGKEVTLKVPYIRGHIYVTGDFDMINRAITNLVENALKFTPKGGRIEVALVKNKDDVQIIVRDNGPGIAPENIERIFDRKVRIRQTKHVRGLGLGLFIVRNVARKHGGQAWVETAMGEGSAFYLSLPLRHSNGAK